MRSPNINSAFYSPQPVPSNPSDLANYLRMELTAIQNVIGILAAGHVDQSYAAPTKPRDGDIRLFDGVSYNPGQRAIPHTSPYPSVSMRSLLAWGIRMLMR